MCAKQLKCCNGDSPHGNTESPFMLYEVTGDILLTRAQAIVHGVSPNDHFAQGLALALREQWPAMYKDFRHFTQLKHPSPASFASGREPTVGTSSACLHRNPVTITASTPARRARSMSAMR